MAITLRTEKRDGNMYYIIGSHDLSDAHLIEVDTIGDRDALVGADGFVLVLHPSEGEPHDETVHRGWAMYARARKTDGGYTWRKVAAEESVNGIWDIDKELLGQFVTWITFLKFRTAQQILNEKYDHYGTVIDAFNAFMVDLQGVRDKKDIISSLGEDAADQLTYKGKTVSSTYIYDHISEDRHLQWVDPTQDSFTPVTTNINTSDDIASRFAVLSIAFPGQCLIIREVDDSLSCYYLVKYGSGLLHKFMWTITGGPNGQFNVAVNHVTRLPDAAPEYVTRGFYHLLAPGYCGHVVDRYYVCFRNESSQYEWGDVFEVFHRFGSYDYIGSGDTYHHVTSNHPTMPTCHRKEWNTAVMTWNDPPETIDANGDIVKFAKSTIIRKIGSPPMSITDGTVIYSTTKHNEFSVYQFTDTFPITNQPVFYGVFSQASNGWIYGYADMFDTGVYSQEAVFPDWAYIKQQLWGGHIAKVLSVGDVLVSPFNTVLGRSIDFKVSRIEAHAVYLVATRSIGSLCYDAAEPGMVKTTKTSWTYGASNTRYSFGKIADASDVSIGNIIYDKYDSTGDEQGTPESYGYYDMLDANGNYTPNWNNIVYNPTYQPSWDEHHTQIISGRLHGNNNWELSNLGGWLNNNTASWYPPRVDNLYDVNGLPYQSGFLYGFKADQNFFELLSEVTLPDNDAIAQLDPGATFWVADQSAMAGSTYNVQACRKNPDRSVTKLTFTAETECEVFPVIKLLTM